MKLYIYLFFIVFSEIFSIKRHVLSGGCDYLGPCSYPLPDSASSFSFFCVIALALHNFFVAFLFIVKSALQAEKVFNQDLYFKKTVKYVGEPMTHLESIASSAVYFPLTILI